MNLGSSINDVTVLGVGGGQGFCDDSQSPFRAKLLTDKVKFCSEKKRIKISKIIPQTKKKMFQLPLIRSRATRFTVKNEKRWRWLAFIKLFYRNILIQFVQNCRSFFQTEPNKTGKNDELDQGWAKCGSRAKSGPLRHFVRPAEYLFSIRYVNLY